MKNNTKNLNDKAVFIANLMRQGIVTDKEVEDLKRSIAQYIYHRGEMEDININIEHLTYDYATEVGTVLDSDCANEFDITMFEVCTLLKQWHFFDKDNHVGGYPEPVVY